MALEDGREAPGKEDAQVTPKEQVKKLHPQSLAEHKGDCWKVYAAPPGMGGPFRQVLGMDTTARGAWQDAAAKVATSTEVS
jgi:hypothetical protein